MAKEHNVLDFVFRSVLPKTRNNYFYYKTKAEALEEIFIADAYKFFVDDFDPHTIVLDIGAYIGDTAVYFARQKNVDFVYSYDPYENNYNEIIKNVALAKVSDKVEALRLAIATSEADLAENAKQSGVYYSVGNYHGRKVEYTTLKIELDRIKAKHPGKPIAIKCDIEGEEFKVFNNDLDLTGVARLAIEYHVLKGDPLIKLLTEKGYTVKTIYEREKTGMIYAFKGTPDNKL
jgi:FkbM family methyltransferase